MYLVRPENYRSWMLQPRYTTFGKRVPVPQSVLRRLDKYDDTTRKLSGVYFVQCRASGRVKIGVTRNLRTRYKQLNTSASMGLGFIGILQGEKQTKEKEIHHRFRHLRRQGEWFDVDEVLQRAIERRFNKRIPTTV